MSLKQQAEIWLRTVVSKHLGSNIRRYKWSSYLGEVSHNSLGGISFLPSCEGKVAEVSDEFTLVKTAASCFCVVSNALLGQPVAEGDKIGLTFYKPKRFDGTKADGSDDPSEGGVRTVMLTGAASLFPVKWEGRYLGINERFADAYTEIRNPYLRDLITQLERMPVSNGLRAVVNVLIDANATGLTFNDPAESESASSPPAIRMAVSTEKHKGQVEISYDRAMDVYAVRLTPDSGSGPLVLENVYFNQLGEVLIDGIDDGRWMLAAVAMIKPAPKKRKLAQPAEA